jgi:putative transcriptional regulator
VNGSGALRGKLLAAGPGLIDPNFVRTVVLVCDHGPDGALGVILNRPTGAAASLFLPEWSGYLTTPAVVFEGGPVQRETAVALAGLEPWPGDADVLPVAHGVGLIDLSPGPEALAGALVDLRVFSGYAGWGMDQLESEVAGGDWFVLESERPDLFPPDAAELWRRVLRRQGGRTAMYANFPDDPRDN